MLNAHMVRAMQHIKIDTIKIFCICPSQQLIYIIDILNVDSGVDYRLRTLQQAEIYHSPLDEQAQHNLDKYYTQLVSSDKECQTQIAINHRKSNKQGKAQP